MLFYCNKAKVFEKMHLCHLFKEACGKGNGGLGSGVIRVQR